MWRNYLRVGYRALVKSPLYAGINVLGLALGMAACLMILLFVRYELSFDRDLPGGADIYQAQTRYTGEQTSTKTNSQMVPYVAKAAMTHDFPQIRASVFFVSAAPLVLHRGGAMTVDDMKFVDDRTFDVFPWPLLQGDPRTALAAPGRLVLTQKEALRQFGRTDVVGRTLVLVSLGRKLPFRVTGVLKDRPRNTHIPLSILARIEPVTFFAPNPDFRTDWGKTGGWTYYRLAPGTDVATINAAMPAWEKRHIPDQKVGSAARFSMADIANFSLTPIRDVHLGDVQSSAMAEGNDRGTITAFAIVALLILAMACVNFTNLATARATQRAREVALRKVLGASRGQLIAQFLGESIAIAATAMLLGLALVELTLPVVSRLFSADLVLHYFGRSGLIVPIALLVLLVGLAGGIYPAFFLSRFQPAQILKANKSTTEAPGSAALRSLLVLAQFAVSIMLIICTGVIYAQTVYARTADPGFRREGLMRIENSGRLQLKPVLPKLLESLSQVEGVTGVGRGNIAIATDDWGATGVLPPGARRQVSLGSYAVDAGYFPTLQIPILAGRTFDARQKADFTETPYPEVPAEERALVSRGARVVINARAAAQLGFASPAAAIGRRIGVGLVNDAYGGIVPATIIGVVANARLRSIREPEEAIVYTMNRRALTYLMLRYSGDAETLRRKLAAAWHRVAPEVPFIARDSDSLVDGLYAQDRTRAVIFAGFSLLAILVGCLGLFGLSSFAADRRTREIGIRKALGARTRDLVGLLVWQFSKPVIAANLIAWPLAWWAMRNWLAGFDTHIALSPWMFLGASALALLVALATITAHAYRVASASPAASLRYE